MSGSSLKGTSSPRTGLGFSRRVGRAAAVSAVGVLAAAATTFASVAPGSAPVADAAQVGSSAAPASQPTGMGDASTTDATLMSVKGAKGYKLQRWNGIVPRWDACSDPYTVKVSTPGLKKRAKKKALSEVRWGVRKLSKATGVKFRFRGRTKEVPHAKRQVKSADVVVSYVKPRQAKSFPLAGSTVGYGGAWWTSNGKRMSGFVMVDVPQSNRLSLRRTGGETRPSVLMHELGHVMGLDHVKRRGEQMFPSITKASPATFGRGDRAGLRRLGAKAGCVR